MEEGSRSGLEVIVGADKAWLVQGWLCLGNKATRQAVTKKLVFAQGINPDWNFEKMGIGGLDKEFSDIFRRAFASRVFPPEIVEQMGEF